MLQHPLPDAYQLFWGMLHEARVSQNDRRLPHWVSRREYRYRIDTVGQIEHVGIVGVRRLRQCRYATRRHNPPASGWLPSPHPPGAVPNALASEKSSATAADNPQRGFHPISQSSASITSGTRHHGTRSNSQAASPAGPFGLKQCTTSGCQTKAICAIFLANANWLNEPWSGGRSRLSTCTPWSRQLTPLWRRRS